MRNKIKVEYKFIREILESMKINKVVKILNSGMVTDENEYISVVKGLRSVLDAISDSYFTAFGDDFKIYPSIIDDEIKICVDGYEKFRAFRNYIYKNYTVESFSKKNHVLYSELNMLANLIFRGSLPYELKIGLDVPSLKVSLRLNEDIGEELYGTFGVFDNFIEKYEKESTPKTNTVNSVSKNDVFVKSLEHCADKLNLLFNDLNTLFRMIPKYNDISENYVVKVNMALKAIFDDKVTVIRVGRGVNSGYELDFKKFNNIFNSDTVIDCIAECDIRNYIQLLLQTNCISGINIDDNNILKLDLGSEQVNKLNGEVGQLAEFIKITGRLMQEQSFKDACKPIPVKLYKNNMDVSVLKNIIDTYTVGNNNPNKTERDQEIHNFTIDTIRQYNSTYGTDFILDIDGKLISHEAALVAPIVDKLINAVREYDFETIDECMSEIPEPFKFKTVKTVNKITIKYGRGEF